MKDRKQGSANGAAELTMGEHLWLHQHMEHRAHELWLAGGCQRRTSLNNWVQAERETWKKFEKIRPVSASLGGLWHEHNDLH